MIGEMWGTGCKVMSWGLVDDLDTEETTGMIRAVVLHFLDLEEA